MSAKTVKRSVLKWAERFTPGDRWDTEDLRDLETALGGTVEAHPTSHWRREVDELRAFRFAIERWWENDGHAAWLRCPGAMDELADILADQGLPRQLAEHEKAIRAEAWAEGFNAGYADQANRDTGKPMPENPYRPGHSA